ncbi:MAG: type II secretion system GspH family protein [Planctomycetaceae bacterium]|nr:type II secretion system GspH family protein [Planctomycetaceae bacterium]
MKSRAGTIRSGRSGMTLMEIMVVLAIILILISVVVTAGKSLQERAAVDLTRSMFEVLDTALQQYYDDFSKFPFITHVDAANLVLDTDSDGYRLDAFIGEYSISKGAFPLPTDPMCAAFESSSALFYFLNKVPNSRKIAAAMSESLITSKDDGGMPIMITLDATSETIDLPRYIDAWKTNIRYEYIDGTAFPVLTSAGPDKVFGTGDDITNK